MSGAPYVVRHTEPGRWEVCPKCFGEGKVEVGRLNANDPNVVLRTCTACGGDCTVWVEDEEAEG